MNNKGPLSEIRNRTAYKPDMRYRCGGRVDTAIPEYGLGGKIKKGFKKIKKKAKKLSKPFTAPFTAVYEGGKELVKGNIGKAFQEAGDEFGDAGKVITPYLGLIPSIGVPLAATVGAASAALSGDNRQEILMGGLKGGLSGYAGSRVGGLPGILDAGFKGTLSNLGGIGGVSKLAGGANSLRGLAGLAGAGTAGYALGKGNGKDDGGSGGRNILSEQQQEYFNRQETPWDFSKLQQDASAAGLGLRDYISRNWNSVSTGQTPQFKAGDPMLAPVEQPLTPYQQLPPGFNGQQQRPNMGWQMGMRPQGTPQQFGLSMQPMQPMQEMDPQTYEDQQQFARGGLNRMVQGPGSGRDDMVPAMVSPGEWIADAETVAMLGDGSSEEGARLLDEMRERIRAHKGKAMAKGKFSPNAKSPLAYLKMSGARK